VHQIRIQNPLQRKAQDIDLAVKDLLDHLRERNITVSLKRVSEKDPFIYMLELTQAKTSQLRSRQARTSQGGPYSHIPKDRFLKQKVKLGLSGGQLMVQRGGGYQQLLEFMEHKGYFYGSSYEDEK